MALLLLRCIAIGLTFTHLNRYIIINFLIPLVFVYKTTQKWVFSSSLQVAKVSKYEAYSPYHYSHSIVAGGFEEIS